MEDICKLNGGDRDCGLFTVSSDCSLKQLLDKVVGGIVAHLI